MKVLGIETSCDETAAAVVENGRNMLSNVVASSVELHAAYGGVVPEIAARSHIESIIPVINRALIDAFEAGSLKPKAESKDKELLANSSQPSAKFDPWDQIDAIAVTNRPGLLGSLLIGVLTARTLAILQKKPLFGIDHVLAHSYANFLTEKADSLKLKAYSLNDKQPQFPALALIVSGGHTQLMLYKNHTDYTLLGQTKDDAVGEAFDKVAKILGLPYPGGPSIEKVSVNGEPASVKLPKARLDSSYDFSFSGLKTAVLREAQKMAGQDFTFPSTMLPAALTAAQKADLAASFQVTAAETLADAVVAAEKEFAPKNILLAGGVAANRKLRDLMAYRLKAPLLYPDIKLCTDNAAMIAAAAYYWQQPADNPYTLGVVSSL